jgi:hypothetical protein
MIILKETKQPARFDFDDDSLYPPILYQDFNDPRGYTDSRICDRTLELPDDIHWNKHFTNFHLYYDFNEQIYKKRKSYFHISNAPFLSIKGGTAQWITPVAFFAMDIKICIDYLRIDKKVSCAKWAYIHHCVNVETMNLFNPDSKNDVNAVSFSKKAVSHLARLYASSRPHRYWGVLEQNYIMSPVYKYRGKTPFDGIALNFKNRLTGDKERVEGLCLFQRAASKMKVMRIAAVNNIFDSNFDPRNYTFESPESIVSMYQNGYYPYSH